MNKKEKLKGLTGFDKQETVGVSPWLLSVIDELGAERKAPHWTYTHGNFSFEIIEGTQSLWIVTRFPAEGEIAFRAAYCPDGKLEIDEIQQTSSGIEAQIRSTVGGFRVELEFPRPDRPLLHYKTRLNPVAPLLIPFWPRDIFPLGKEEDLTDSEGVIYASQDGPRSGLVYFSLTRPKAGAVLYFQNLTSLNDYASQTETSLADVVGGKWPELGFALPGTTEKTIEAEQEIVLSDAYIIFSPEVPKDDLVMAEQFLDMLAQVYLALPRVETEYVHWPDIARKSLRDLSESEKCQSEVRGQRFLNAYVGDYASFYYPPNLPKEVMVEKPKTGELDPKLWIPLEDMYDGWEQAGQVGQEVYGAGMPFAILPRQYWHIPDEKLMIFADYPVQDFSSIEKGEALFRVLGDQRLSGRMRIMPTGRAKLPKFQVRTEREDTTETLQGRETPEGHIEYKLFGDRTVIVQWAAKQNAARLEKKSKNGRKGSKK